MENQKNDIYELETSIQVVNNIVHTKVEWIFKDFYQTFYVNKIKKVCTDIIKPHANCDCKKMQHSDNFRLEVKIHEFSDAKSRFNNVELFFSCIEVAPYEISVTVAYNEDASTLLDIKYNLPGWRFLRTINIMQGKIKIILDIIIDKPIYEKQLEKIFVNNKASEYKLCRDMEQLLDSGSFSDVMLLSVDGTPFKAHRAILASRSDMFNAMFKHDQNNNVTTSYKVDVLGELLLYIYSGRSPNITKMADALLVAADYYQLASLKKLCIVTLHNTIIPDNAIRTLELAEQYSLTELLNTTLQFIRGNGDLIIKTEGWKNLKSLDLVKKLFEVSYQ